MARIERIRSVKMSIYIVLIYQRLVFNPMMGCAPKATCKPLLHPLNGTDVEEANRLIVQPEDELATLFNHDHQLQTFELSISHDDLLF